MITQDQPPQGAQLISRAAEILRAIPRGTPIGRRLRDIALSTGLTEPTVRRILLALMHEKFVVQDADTKLYRLGALAFELGLAAGANSRMLEVCRPHIRSLASDTGATAILVMRTGMETVCLEQVDGPFPLRSQSAKVGERLLLGVGTGGATLLAQMSDKEIDEILSASAFDNSPVSREEIRERVSRSRKKGFTDISDKPIPGIRGVAVVIPTTRGLPTLSLSLADQHERMTDEHVARVLPVLTVTADRIGAALDLH